MRDNSEMTDLTKVNTETEFQPEDAFKNESKYVTIFGHPLKGIVMDSIAIRNPIIAFDINEDLKIYLREIGRISFNVNRENVENYEIQIENSQRLPRTTEVAKSIKKILNRLINNRVVTSPLTLNIYNNFIDAYETDPSFEPQGEIFKMLAFAYDCYIQAYLTDVSSKPNFWSETPQLLQQKYLEKFHTLLEWRLENSLEISFFDKVSLFVNLTNFAYGINFENLVNDYRSDIDLYIKNISNILCSPNSETTNLGTDIDFKSNRLDLDETDIRTSIAELNFNELAVLRSQYIFDNDPELLIYLQRKPDIFTLLKDACPNFIRYFNSQSLSLGIWNDIDNSNLKYLTITIHVSKDIDDSLLDLNEFRGSYWFTLPWSLTSDIIIGFDY